MFTTAVIILICLILIVSYLFDLSSRFTKIPGVVLLIFVGIFLKYISEISQLEIPNLDPLTPLLGTIGLILIVLEGSMDLQVSRSKIPIVRKTFLSGLFLLIANSLIGGAYLAWHYDESFLKGLVNAIPIGVISSALAIPAAQNLSEEKKEFITYESSFSDILGVLFFNFFALNTAHGLPEIWIYTGQIITIVIISVICSLFLGFLLQRIHHHIKLIPIIATLILVYMMAKLMHMPSLVLVLVFGIFLNNIRHLELIPALWKKINYEVLEKETTNFKHLVGEIAFTIRSLFFITLGFNTDLASIFDLNGLLEALFFVSIVRLSRFILFRFVLGISLLPELFFAPRGLITILLFLGIPAHYAIPGIDTGLLVQIVLVTSLIMTIGLMVSTKNAATNPSEEVPSRQ